MKKQILTIFVQMEIVYIQAPEAKIQVLQLP